MRTFIHLVAVWTVLYAAGCSGSGSSSNSNDAAAETSSGSSGSSGATDAAVDSGTCTTDADCGTGARCGFPESAGCSATGTCFPVPGFTCNAILLACACNGSDINVACNGLPSGYAPKPFAHSGVCGLDSGMGHAFSCGTLSCNSATQYCSIVEYGHAILPDGGQGSSQTVTCGALDGGPSCPGTSSTTGAGQCGCYESPTGEVTITECTP